MHSLHGPELRALRPLQGSSPYVFITEAGTPTTTPWFLRMIQRTGVAARLTFAVHPHMLKHSTESSRTMDTILVRLRITLVIAICGTLRDILR